MVGPRYCSWAPERLILDMRVRLMTVIEFGAYTSLLMEIWLDPSGSLPDDPEQLAVYSRLGEAWPQHERKLMGLLYVKDQRVRSEIVDEARERIMKRSEQAKEAVAKRERKRAEWGQFESETPSNDKLPIIERSSSDDRPMIGRSSDDKGPKISRSSIEKVNEKVNEKENPSLSPKGDGGGARGKSRIAYSPGFEAFWRAWKALGGKTTLNKVAAFEAYKKCLRRGAEDGDLLAAVGVYDKYLAYRCKAGKADARDYVPMPETWLNQDRWTSEYPDEVLDQMVGTPASGRDFYWDSYKDAEGCDYVRRYVFGPGGEKTGELFNEHAWREARRGDLV